MYACCYRYTKSGVAFIRLSEKCLHYVRMIKYLWIILTENTCFQILLH